MVAFYVPIGLMGGATPATISFESYSHVVDTGNTHTHSGLSFGPARADRFLIISLTYNANNITTLSNVTIGGVAATIIVKAYRTTPTSVSSEIWGAPVPTGTSGSVVLTVNTSGNLWNSSVGLYAATDLLSTTATTTTGGNDTSSLGTLSMSIPVQSGGIVVAAAFLSSGNATSSTWTGITKTFLDPMKNNLGGLGAQEGACDAYVGGQTVNAVAQFNSGGLVGIVGTMAAFR